MSPSNLSVVEIKAFVPARDFAESIGFYQALGFTCASVFEGIAYFRCGESSFLLRDFLDPSGVLWRIAQNIPRASAA